VGTDGSLSPRPSARSTQGMPFHAHEVLEDARMGVTHAAHAARNAGARKLLLRGADHIEPYRNEPPYDIETDAAPRSGLRRSRPSRRAGSPPGTAPIAGLSRWARDRTSALEGPITYLHPASGLGMSRDYRLAVRRYVCR
jgi:hypothetical protein